MAKKKVFLTIVVIISFLMITCLVMSFSMQQNTNADINGNKNSSHPEYYNKVMEQEKPVFLFFYTDWCMHCVKFMPVYEELEKTYKDKYNFIKINADNAENTALVQDYYVMGIPAVYIVEPKTQKRHAVNNFILHDIDTLKKELDKFIRR